MAYAKLFEDCKPSEEIVSANQVIQQAASQTLEVASDANIESKRERLHALLLKHLDYARDIVEAHCIGERRFRDWSKDLREDALMIVNFSGWDIFQRQLDKDAIAGKWKYGDVPGIQRFIIRVIDEGLNQVIYHIPISPDYDRFKLAIESMPPFVSQIRSDGFR